MLGIDKSITRAVFSLFLLVGLSACEKDPSEILGDLQGGTSECIPAMLRQQVIPLGPFNLSNGRAGNLAFPAGEVTFDRIFTDFGFVISGDQTDTGLDKANPQPTFRAPQGTSVHSLVDGVVVGLPELWSTNSLGDISIHIQPDGVKTSCYVVVETEHVVNPVVAVGDRVVAGQVIAEVGPLGSEVDGLWTVEIGILTSTSRGNPLHVCPFAYFVEEVREQRLNELRQLFSDWEAFKSDTSLYDESAWVAGIPGCLSSEIEE